MNSNNNFHQAITYSAKMSLDVERQRLFLGMVKQKPFLQVRGNSYFTINTPNIFLILTFTVTKTRINISVTLKTIPKTSSAIMMV